jgi:hypothetical protein
MVLRVLWWWLPWLLAFGVSSALAYAADEALMQRLPTAVSDAPALQSPVPAPYAPSALNEGRSQASANVRWLRIRFTNPAGERVGLRCRTQPDVVTVDEMVLAYEDVKEFVTTTCDQLFGD